MAGSLEPVKLKVERAKEHFVDLQTRIRAFEKAYPYGVVANYDYHRRQLVFKARILKELPLEWSIVVGDIVHNLRSSLDHLVCQLAQRRGMSCASTGFPVYYTRPVEERNVTRFVTKIKPLSLRAKTLIVRLQPYRGMLPDGRTIAVADHPLATIDGLSVRDKHKLLNLHTVGMDMTGVGFGGPGITLIRRYVSEPVRIAKVKDGTILKEFAVEATAGMGVNPQFVFQVSFEEQGPGKGQPVIPTLQGLIDFVEQAIIPLFEPFFL